MIGTSVAGRHGGNRIRIVRRARDLIGAEIPLVLEGWRTRHDGRQRYGTALNCDDISRLRSVSEGDWRVGHRQHGRASGVRRERVAHAQRIRTRIGVNHLRNSEAGVRRAGNWTASEQPLIAQRSGAEHVRGERGRVPAIHRAVGRLRRVQIENGIMRCSR